MLKTTILVVALAASATAFAHDERNRRDRDDLGQLVYETRPVTQPGEASLIQYVAPQYVPPQVVSAPAPADYQQPCDDAPTVFISQPAQTASVRVK